MIRFAIVGALGRMGIAIARLSQQDNNIELAKTFEHAAHDATGKTYSEASGLSGFDMKIEQVSAEAIDDLQGVIDFSSPDSSVATAELCVKKNVPLVIGTTGWNNQQLDAIKAASKKIPILLASNMSVGVNLLFALTRAAARTLKGQGFDPEITEVHHKMKKDAPSGTATTLKEIVLDEMSRKEDNVTYGREGMVGERPGDELGVMALRGGDVVGDHSVFFFGEGERVVLSHQANTRDTFAQGALFALKYLQKQGMGLYNMQDALGLHF